jgi:hypothetical protein
VEYFTDDQHRENKVRDLPFETALLIKPQASVWDLFKETFHLMKDDEYMLYEGAACEAVLLFIGGIGPSPDPLALQWDMTATHKSDWNQKVIDHLCSLYMTMQESNHWTGRSQQSIRRDITLKFDQCRKCWRKACPQVTSDGTHETMQQVGDRLVDHMNERLQIARVLSRRTTVSRLHVSLVEWTDFNLFFFRNLKPAGRSRQPCLVTGKRAERTIYLCGNI